MVFWFHPVYDNNFFDLQDRFLFIRVWSCSGLISIDFSQFVWSSSTVQRCRYLPICDIDLFALWYRFCLICGMDFFRLMWEFFWFLWSISSELGYRYRLTYGIGFFTRRDFAWFCGIDFLLFAWSMSSDQRYRFVALWYRFCLIRSIDFFEFMWEFLWFFVIDSFWTGISVSADLRCWFFLFLLWFCLTLWYRFFAIPLIDRCLLISDIDTFRFAISIFSFVVLILYDF